MLESISRGSQLINTFLKPRMLESIRGESTYKNDLEVADVRIYKGGSQLINVFLKPQMLESIRGGESTYKCVFEAADVGINKRESNL